MRLQYQHVEPVHQNSVSSTEVGLRLLTRERRSAKRDAGFENCILSMLYRFQENRCVELAGDTQFGREIERRDDHVINSLNSADVFDVVDGGPGLDQETADGLVAALAQIVEQLDAPT